MKGILTAIQRFSLHDGPGIRSTVFFKGCNMRCSWCHNPETFEMTSQLMYYRTKCVGCGACTQICPLHTIGEDGKLVLERDGCTHCGKCADVCFSGALEMCGKEYDVSDILSEVLQDTDYYIRSGGGVTLSGGEVLLQGSFALELLKALKQNGISTAIETNLNISYDTILPLLPYIDLIMCDLKIWDADRHRKWTGSDNRRIIDNIKALSATGVPMIVRTPVIPGVNDSSDDIGDISRFIGTLDNILYYELLNFNPLGGSKYIALDMNDSFKGQKPLREERMNSLYETALKNMSRVRIG